MSDPIVSRLDRLHDQWIEFRLLPDARVFRWLLAPDELRMIETFVAMESDDRAGELPDLFVTCSERFADVDSYGVALRASLVRQYEEGRADMEQEGMDASWEPPPPTAGSHSLFDLILGCTSLCSHYSGMERLVLVLLPSAVSDYREWQRWLRGAAIHLPVEVRLVVVDDAREPVLEALAAAEPERVHSVTAELDMPDFLKEMAAMAGVSGPDGRFRVQFTAMTAAVASGKLSEAGRAARGALAVATEQGWLHLVGAVHFAMAAGFMNAGRMTDALSSYRDADAAGKALAASDEKLGARIRLNSAFGVGSTLLANGRFAEAAGVYEVSASMARKVGDPWLLTDCWRMAGYCREQSGEASLAWERGFMALQAAEGIPETDRANSTIPFVREALLRLAGDSAAHRQAVEARVAALLGKEKRDHDPVPAVRA